jgi:phosphohistidine phosphatase
MKSIIFIRHSFAEAGYDKIDFDRALINGGFDKIEKQAQQFIQKSIKIDLVVSSSAKRTQQTTKYFLQKIQQKPSCKYEDWIYEDYTTSDFIAYFRKIENTIDCMLFVGHNPSISVLASQMSLHNSFGFQPATILKLDFDIEDWKNLEIRSGYTDFLLA